MKTCTRLCSASQRRMSMRMTRRKFITAAGGDGVAATTGLLRLPGAATAAPATIRLLSDSSYNENSDKAVAKIGEAFAAQHNAAFAGEFIDQPEVAAKLNAEEQAQAGHDIGHPVGFAISQTEDSNAALYPLLWAFGAGVTDTTGRLAIDSHATNASLDFVRALAAQMDPAVYSWDDGGNNKDILSGHGSYTINAPSIYLRARREKMAFAAAIRQAQPPAGPRGRFFYVDIHGWGIMKFGSNIGLAKQLLRSMYSAESQKVFLTLGQGYDMPVLPRFDANPPYAADPQLRPELNYMPSAHLAAYPAGPDARAEKAYQTFIIPNMFARAAQGASNKDAIAFAVKALTDLGYSAK